MKYLLDTDWIIDCLKGKNPVSEKVKALRSDGLAVSMVSLAEIYVGIYRSNEPSRHQVGFKDFLSGVSVLEITEEVCMKFGEIKNNLRVQGNIIGDFDLLIASSALVNGLVLLTGNLRHYQRIHALQIGSS